MDSDPEYEESMNADDPSQPDEIPQNDDSSHDSSAENAGDSDDSSSEMIDWSNPPSSDESELGEEDEEERPALLRLIDQRGRMARRLRRPFLRILAHISGRSRDALEDDSDDGLQNAERPDNITFDQYLPTSHSYLGEMDECSGVQYIDRESFIVLPILQVPDFILVPGQTMPLDISHPQQISLLKNVMCREDKTFGVVLASYSSDSLSPNPVEYGCTAELRSIREEEVHEIQTMVGIALGRQRFKIMERRRQLDGSLVAKVQILSDEEFLPPASGAMLNVHRKCYATSAKRLARKESDRIQSLQSAGFLTGNPSWVYKMYDVNYLRKWIIEEIRDWYPEVDCMTLPVSPAAFSFWILSHCIMTNAMRLALLKIDSSVQRLRSELDILKKFTLCTCISCGNQITERKHIFNMSVSGPMNAYVNPSGHIHETLTVYSAKGLLRVSHPSEEHSWFPGYAWTICQCDSCGSHIGWKFTATKPTLVPKVFWGLTRSALYLHMKVEDAEIDEGDSSHQRNRSLRSSVLRMPSRSDNNYNWRPML